MTNVKAATPLPHICSSSLGSNLSATFCPHLQSAIVLRSGGSETQHRPHFVADRHHFKSNQLSHCLQMIQLSGLSTGSDPWPVNGDTSDRARCVERTSGFQSQCCAVSLNVLSRRSTGCDPWPVNGDTLDKARCVERTSGLQSQCCTVSVNVLSRRVD